MLFLVVRLDECFGLVGHLGVLQGAFPSAIRDWQGLIRQKSFVRWWNSVVFCVI